MCVRESERDLLPNKETTTNFDAPKMSFECLKRERRMISVGWFGSSAGVHAVDGGLHAVDLHAR